ncbi:hypothetical protein F5Y16DRAFT_416047 [Xylariaceae sp. FL0255]|nr:hypothetical protein F5Y16DRAFT_416047 [Xylariaceae sp. FL0255]
MGAFTYLITAALYIELFSTIQVVEQNAFDWDRFAKYSFRLALICFIIAIISLLFGDVIPNLIKRLLALPAGVRVTLTSLLAGAVIAPHEIYFNDTIHTLGALLFGLAALQLGIALEADDPERHHISHRIELALVFIYGATAVLVGSNFIWSIAMIVLGSWFGTFTAYTEGTYYLSMDHPAHFVVFGASIIGLSYILRSFSLTVTLWSTTRIWGMLYLFVALWILSVFGNDEMTSNLPSRRTRPTRLAVSSLLFLGAAVTAVWHGLRYGDSTTKGFGLTFFGINVYTKFFEYAWSRCSKPVVFIILALSLGLIGKYAESINVALQQHYPET